MSHNTSDDGMDVDVSREYETSTPSHSSSRVIPRPTIRGKPAHQVGYVYSEDMTHHVASYESDDDEHPEHPNRISRIYAALRQAGYLDMMKELPIRPCHRDEVMLVHSEDLWDRVLAIKSMSEQDIADSRVYYETLSLYVHESTPYAARLSCGGVIEACLAVARDEVSKSFAIVRPPGHHAEPDEHMGFCFFNNVAVAAKVVQLTTPLKRIMILDWDVHHGNGTQKAFADDPTVLYVSIHRFDDGSFYPSTQYGSMLSCGEGAGTGFSVNVAWPDKGMGDADYLHAFHKIVMPIAMEFAPELVIVSAGFDAAEGDILGGCNVTPNGYAHMTHMLAGLAGGRMAVALEGGYSLDAISASALAVTQILLGEAPPRLAPMRVSAIGTETVWHVSRVQSKYWRNVSPVECEPKEDYGPLAASLPEILLAHRRNQLAMVHDMSQIPLPTNDFSSFLAAEAWCTGNIFENDTLVVLFHELGELRAELESPLTCDLHMERTYMIDFTRELVNWIVQEKYSLIDVNLLEKMLRKPQSKGELEARAKTYDGLKRDIVTYMWDNYIHISGAKRIVLIGHGAGCEPIMTLLSKRTFSIMKYVKKVIQVIPHSTILPRARKEPETLRPWYFKHSAVFVPATHRIFHEKPFKSYGTLYPLDEEKPIKLIMKAMPVIQGLVKTAFTLEAS